MEFPRKQLLVVGDRVLITVEEGDDRTRVGLYLPATAIGKDYLGSSIFGAAPSGSGVQVSLGGVLGMSLFFKDRARQ